MVGLPGVAGVVAVWAKRATGEKARAVAKAKVAIFMAGLLNLLLFCHACLDRAAGAYERNEPIRFHGVAEFQKSIFFP
jgi:hypothetical protein